MVRGSSGRVRRRPAPEVAEPMPAPQPRSRSARSGVTGLLAGVLALGTGTLGQLPAQAQHAAVAASANASSEIPGLRTDGYVAPMAVWDPIPFGATRRAQTARYAGKHYGVKSAALTDVRQVVLHYTVSPTYASARSVFASNAKARTPTGEYVSPGTCTHFVVDRDGTIYQLVSLRWICRHAVGLNHRSVGIEFVERSSADNILNRPKQMAAGVALVRWLQQRYGIADNDVIGHGMVNSSKFFQERAKGWRNTHTDWNSRQVAAFRKQL